MISSLTALLVFLAIGAQAQTYYSLELGSTTQSLNDQRIPGKGGTKFSLTDFGKGPFTSYRVYLGHKWDRHELRTLYAPFALNLRGQLKNPTTFKSTLFQPGVNTEAYYQFNSYRLTYSYALEKKSDWDYRIGFSGKIRDAEVKLTQGNLSESKKNVGFVPLLNFQAFRKLNDLYSFRFDLDALGAPQGRAIDLALFLERQISIPETQVFAGYRTVEGGADNDTVYNFAWIHTLTLGLKGQF
jgi:hypothetical protein